MTQVRGDVEKRKFHIPTWFNLILSSHPLTQSIQTTMNDFSMKHMKRVKKLLLFIIVILTEISIRMKLWDALVQMMTGGKTSGGKKSAKRNDEGVC